MSQGRFIVLEGLDGAGTSTQAEEVSQYLRAIGFPVATTREPSDGLFGKAVRRAIEGDVKLPAELLSLGFAADRLSHMSEPGGITELLDRGTWVICDRYVLSSLAYQASQGVDLDWLVDINKYAPDPDATVFVDTSVSVCLRRIAARDNNKDDLFHRRAALYEVRKNYFRALDSRRFIGRLVTVNGNESINGVRTEILNNLADIFHDDLGLFVSSHSSMSQG